MWPGTIVSFHKRWVFLCQLFDSFPNLKLKGVAPNSISSNLKKQYKQMINVKGNLIGVVLLLLLPFQIIGRLIFLTPSLTTRLILKFLQNVTSFVVSSFINTRSSKMT